MDIAILSYLAASDLSGNEPDKWDVIVILDSGLEQQGVRNRIAISTVDS